MVSPGAFRGPLRARPLVTIALLLVFVLSGELLWAGNVIGAYPFAADDIVLLVLMIANTWALLVREFQTPSGGD